MGIFVVIFSVVVMLLVDFADPVKGITIRFYATSAFIVGSITSMICGYIGMSIATKANYRTTY